MTEHLKQALLICVIGCLIAGTSAIVNLSCGIQKAVTDADETIAEAKADLHETQLEISDELIQVHSTIQQLNDAEAEQRKYWNSVLCTS